MNSSTFLNSCKMAAGLMIGATAALAPVNASAAVSQQPLSLTEGVSPNILVTLDDSGSMARGYTPDAISGQSDRRAGRSSSYNAIYYNPDITYVVPKKVTLVSGTAVVQDYPTPSFTSAYNDGFAQSGTRVDLSSDYRAPWGTSWNYSPGFLTSCPSGLSCNWGQARAHYFRYNVSGSSCPASPVSNDDSCYSLVSLPPAQETNFAIWYSFYRTRNLATRSAANLAFYSLPNNVRLTWGALNSCDIGSDAGGDCKRNSLQQFSDQHRVNFFDWLSDLPSNGNTPLHSALQRAGDLLQNNPSAYRDASGSEYACRASYHILMSDGLWNQRPSGNTNHDGGLGYPYKDDQSNTLADWAYHYWITDLRTDLANNVPSYIPFRNANATLQYNDPRNNPATWQNMINFTVGLGLSNSLTNSNAPTWGGSTFANYSQLMSMGTNGTRWPAMSSNSPNTVYDLWHTAINSRGEFFSAESPDALVAAFDTILSRIADRNTSAAAPAINSGLVDDGSGDLYSLSYQTSYSSADSWAGDIKGFLTNRTFNAATGLYQVNITQSWSAASRIANRNYTDRNIKIATSSITAGQSNLRDFTSANAGSASTTGTLAYWLRQNPDNNGTLDATNSSNVADRLNFLRGDRANEGSKFRVRTTVLGDMVSSRPATVRGARYLINYADKIEPTATGTRSYRTFFQAQQTRAPHVYVGSNDGMLHSFDATNGVEKFAFIPTEVFPKLHELTGKTYEGANHQFYVDGSPVISDVYINNEWRTVLIGTLRAGGKGLFALDVTNPDAVRLLWEFNDSKIPSGNAVRLGYSFSQPTVARLHNGKWAVITGNGYDSANQTNGKAALLIIDLATGVLTKSLEVNGTNGINNGLSTPTVADMNVDGVADYVYAGDIQGNMWRFNLAPSSNSAANPFARQASETAAAEASFQVSYNGAPLYQAISSTSVRQPITAAPTIVRHPSRVGYIVVFGTGKFYQDGDKNGVANVKQSIYGIWDTGVLNNSATTARQPANLTRAGLQAQTMNSSLESTVGGQDARLLSQNSVKWAVPPSTPTGNWVDNSGHKYGWYFDFELGREMMIERAQPLGQTLLFQTLVPNSDPCASGTENWTYAIDAYTGGRTRHHAFVTVRSSINSGNVISAIRHDGEGGISLGQPPGGSTFQACTGLSCEDVVPDPSSIGRQSWRTVEEQ